MSILKNKKKGYLLLELIIYLSLASLLLLGVMDLGLFFTKIYKEEISSYKNEYFKGNSFDMVIEDLLKVKSRIDLNIKDNFIEVYYRMNESRIRKDIIGKNSYTNSIYKKSYDLDNNYSIQFEKNPIVLIDNVKDFEVLEKENLFYVILKFCDGEKEIFVYEK